MNSKCQKIIFVMGDNRDNSQDSRFFNTVGFIPTNNLVGKAQFIFFSLENSRFLEVWKWPKAIRFDRILRRLNDIKKILNALKKIRYRFKNKLLITQALTHPSYFIDSKENVVNPNQFERLEFLGDRVLGLIISSMLFKKYKI